MVSIVTDSSALFPSEKAAEEGFSSLPLHVVIDSHDYRDYENINSENFEELTKGAAKISTSQPSIGEKIGLYDEILKDPEVEILDITIADGLSGTYQSALMAKDSCSDPDRVTVFNSTTLCGPHQELVKTALKMAEEGSAVDEIEAKLQEMLEHEASSVCVTDITHLARSGRLPEAAGKIGSFLRLMPLAVKNDDGTKLSLYGTSRTMKKMIELQEKFLLSKGFDGSWTVYITHGNNPSAAKKAEEYFRQKYPGIRTVVQNLNAMFMVHGGPGCLAIQAMKV